MAIEETNISKKIQVLCSKVGAILLRNNTGLFLTLDGKRKLQSGLGKDTSDLIGWTSKIVTPDMVGKPIAIFTAIEVKTKSGLKGAGQKNFIKAVLKAGGLAGFARNPEDAKEIIFSQ